LMEPFSASREPGLVPRGDRDFSALPGFDAQPLPSAGKVRRRLSRAGCGVSLIR